MINYFLSFWLLVLGIFSVPLKAIAQVTGQVEATAQVIVPISVTVLRNMSFGSVVIGTGQLTLSPSGKRSATGTIGLSSEVGANINQLGIEQQSVVYRCVQEALTNITKHSNARQVNVIAKIILRQMHVQVVDDGIGLPEGHVFPSFCLGLNLQKKRTEELGGHFSIQSNSNGKGTKLHLTFPLGAELRPL